MIKVIFPWNENKLYHNGLLFIGCHCPVAAALKSKHQDRGTRMGKK